MLAFFRKYQKFFFVLITIVIVISFTFFGTYGTLQQTQYNSQKAFESIDGNVVTQQELEEVALFIGTDNEDKLLLGGAWGPNFLNDGVIKKDLIETGMAQLLVKPFLDELRPELQQRLVKEKRFVPYEHPQAKLISAVNAWNVLAPQITEGLGKLTELEDATTPEAFDIRSQLFLAQKKFPHSALRYVLMYQQKQYGWVRPDPNLARTDLALFHYHTLHDWFGKGFVRLAAEFVINSAIIAEKRGYEVSKSEAFADLWRNAEISFQQLANRPNLGVATTEEYFNEQLRRMQIDQARAIEIWRQVLLFRRLFQDLGSSVFIDPFTIEQFQQVAKETIEGQLFRLPEHFRLGDFSALQQFETYLDAVSEREKQLALPQTFKKVEDVEKSHPELVQRRFLIEISKANKLSLQAKISVREMWEWQTTEENWETLKNAFPELAMKKASNKKERFAVLDTLDNNTRDRVDAFSRKKIVDACPQWLDEALEAAKKETKIVKVQKKGKVAFLPGARNPEELIALLDRYPNSEEELSTYSPDGKVYYRIKVLDQAPGYEIITFAEAKKSGTLEALVTKKLKKQYEFIRKNKPEDFKKPDGKWIEFSEARHKIATHVFSDILKAIKQTSSTEPREMIPDYAASRRLLPFMQDLQNQFEKNPSTIEKWVVQEDETSAKFPLRKPLVSQWKIEKSHYKGDRGAQDRPVDSLFSLEPDQWSKAQARASGDIAFFHVQKRYVARDQEGLFEKIFEVQKILSTEAQQNLMQQLIDEMQQKGALSLQFLGQGEENK